MPTSKRALNRSLAGLESALADYDRELSLKCDRLRETARELRAGTINQWHAANRIAKIADEIRRKR